MAGLGVGFGSVSACFTAAAKIAKPAVMSSGGIKSDDRVMCILHLRASKTLIPTAPDMNYVAVRLKLCLPMATGLPIGRNGDFGTSRRRQTVKSGERRA